MLRAAITVAAASAIVSAILAGGLPAPPAGARRTEARARIVQTRELARSSSCDRAHPGSLVYHYPVRPFRRPHPIRGFFGDPRTANVDRLGYDRPGTAGSFSFHNGVDIVASTGTRVYPVVSGAVRRDAYGDEVIVTTDDGRTFQYFHLTPHVRAGQHVVADRTVLGVVKPGWRHVHLSEIDGFRIHNPLDPGHLEPYRDHTAPSVDRLVFRTEDGREADPFRLHGLIEIAADAEDVPPLPVPGVWFDFPVTPALVGWRLVTVSGRTVVRETTVADFRHSEPPNSDFWQVYTAGTYQNFPVFAHHLIWGQPGQYLFRLTRAPLDTTRLRNGGYVLTVQVADVCGNRGSLSELIDVRNRT